MRTFMNVSGYLCDKVWHEKDGHMRTFMEQRCENICENLRHQEQKSAFWPIEMEKPVLYNL